jgi:LuxR family transcriptional regulator, maltose regulon positive regulatory protein
MERMHPTDGPPLLATKLFVPTLRSNRVARPRLQDRLASSGGGHLTLISAPAGSGKSTLLAEWAASRVAPIAWVSLDEGDDDPGRLLHYITTALFRSGAIGDEILLETAQAKTHDSRQAAVVDLLNALSHHGGDLALVLDDYHVVAQGEGHGLVQFIADHLPPNLHLVIASRVDPPLALSRLRARHLLHELRASDLRFTEEEAGAFFNEAMNLELTADQIAELERRTEGWAVGLQMAAISLRGRGEAESFIRSFGGSNRYILDYLTDEVLAGEPEEVRSFLLQTSFLDRLSAPLCDAVTGRSDSAEILARLEAANMFLIPLDEVRYWYRYHHLFTTMLEHQLERSDGVARADLHRRASGWYAANDLPDAAVHHSFLAGDIDRAVEIVSRNAMSRLLEGDTALLVQWLEQLPPERVRSDFDLLLVKALALRAEYEYERAVEVMTHAAKLIHPGTAPYDLGRYLAVSGGIAQTQGRDDRALDELPRAIELLPEESFWSALASFHLGMSHLAKTDLQSADRILSCVGRRQQQPDSVIIGVVAHRFSAQCRLWLGRPMEAVSIAEKWLPEIAAIEASSGQLLPLGAFPYAALADVHAERNDMARAKEYALRALECGRRGFAFAFFEASRSMVRVAEAMGDWDLAMQSLEDARRMITANTPLTHELAGLHYRVLLHRGIVTGNERDLSAVAAWIQEEGLADYRERWPAALASGVYAEFGFLTTARYFIELGRHEEARELLALMLGEARSGQRILSVVDMLILRSLAEERGGAAAAAVETMSEAVTLASAPGFIRLFVHEGAVIQPILRRAAERTADNDFAARVLSSMEASPAPARPAVAELGSLSDRELEVLTLLATGASNREIGRKLFIAAGTVKKHLENIYAKLDARGRVEALAKARELGIL